VREGGDGTGIEFARQVLNAAAQFIRPQVGDRLGVLSLTERPDNLLMWAHYAGQHTGFLIELDGRHEFFDQAGASNELHWCLLPVSYAHERPAVGWTAYERALLAKSLEWEYEQEWRMIVPLGESVLRKAARILDAGGDQVHLFELPPQCIRGLVLGCRMTSAARSEITDLVTSDERYAHVLVRHARQDLNRYGLLLTGQGSILFGHAARALQRDDREAAFASVDRAIELEPDNPEYRAVRGGMKLDKDPAGAQTDLERAVDLNPFVSDNWALLTIAAHRQGDLSRALAAIDEAILHDRDNPEYLWYRAGLQHEMKRFAAAIADLDRAIALRPDEARYFSYRATNHRMLGNTQQVRADVERAIALAPAVARYRAMLGQLLEAEKDWAGAAAAYTEAIQLDSEQPHYYQRRAHAYAQMLDLAPAISDLGEVIARSDSPARAFGLRATLYLDAGDLDAAKRDAARLHELDPKLFADFFPHATEDPPPEEVDTERH
jgi:tetratricopeptide (TPR) repeat protein